MENGYYRDYRGVYRGYDTKPSPCSYMYICAYMNHIHTRYGIDNT